MITPPSPTARDAARDRLAGLAIPAGALGRLGEVAVWWSSVRGETTPAPPSHVRAVVFAGDHGVASHGVSAYPAAITGAMVRAFVSGVAGVSVLARQHDVTLRVLDLGVDGDFPDLDPALGEFKVRRGTEPIHLADAMTADETRRAIDAGRRIAEQEIAAGADLLIGGDMGIGNTTPAVALIAAALGLPADEVVGRGTGIDDAGLALKTDVVATALKRAGDRVSDPVELLTALGSPDLAAHAAFIAAAAEAGVPVLLDGVISVAAATVAERLSPGAAAWMAAGHRSTEKAQWRALEALGHSPLVDVDMRLGEGSGAVAAVPLLRSAALLLSQMALLDELM
ncbi:nicotinate-nucleotide--dimethylbenzimidazole phosphoribosyltransferase [Aeromicrobium sp. 636]|uniref:Nicotinate-nucleotide--dimethylbenzimidazole phosphoribosyltransferase n=1 Tax=Aeromicrobium senzhongii TaxID=2663859 RepID=A0A8I0EV09_9ACTN|nr:MULTISPECIES: nicotinate-nucleotide--dimethylbenzimidazole phosphoribosyltransferase [Aeromicrobium]MBC9226054.1 nicotinate-nucleotide--dimethylbenzimidazole phosphoribosyltransferase [Aeromicrobium senzhongii]MCQ3998161.1 nicotinate-nucleotide--dimethylbenzimidazole phosphoribosyltransferase [Aeromicrobium sp. 636]